MNWLKDLEVGDIVFLRQQNETHAELLPARIISNPSMDFEYGVVSVQGIGELRFCQSGNILDDNSGECVDRIVPAPAYTQYTDPTILIPNSNYLEVHQSWLDLILLKKNSGTVEEFAHSNGIDELDAFWFFKGNPVEPEAFKKMCAILGEDYQRVQRNLSPKFKVGDYVVVPSIHPIYQWHKFKIVAKTLKSNTWFYSDKGDGIEYPENELVGILIWQFSLQEFADRQTNLLVLALLVAKYGCSINPERIAQMRDMIINDDRAIAAGFLAYKKNQILE